MKLHTIAYYLSQTIAYYFSQRKDTKLLLLGIEDKINS